jgi:pimeloyl-ACP methyl ester carboxylesterase
MRHVLRLLALAAFLPAHALAQEPVSFPTDDGGVVHGEVYGAGDRGVVLVHGGRFNKESWRPQGVTIAAAGFRVLAFDFRGYGQSKGPGAAAPMSAPLDRDVLGAVRYLRERGARSIAIVGGSMGAWAAAEALVAQPPGVIDRLVLLGSEGSSQPEKMHGRKLFIVTRNDANADGPRLPNIERNYARVPEPKALIILDGEAHAQFMFATPLADRVMREILQFLQAP